MRTDLTVIIPARNAAHTIPRVLTALKEQQATVPHRVIVVDDGSSDDTARVVATHADLEGAGVVTLRCFPHRGAAAARNTGAREATTPLLLFLGADIVPLRGCLARHLAVHRKMPAASVGCLGFVTWDPALPPSPFMVFLERGPQNAYGAIAGATWVSPRSFCYGANLSMKRSLFLESGGYDAVHFTTYGWEDLEFGERLSEAGFRLFYEPTARAYHAHHVSLKAAEQRMRAAGENARVLHGLHPRMGVLKSSRERWAAPLRQVVFSAPVRLTLRVFANFAETRVLLPRLYQRVLSLSFYDGVHTHVDNSGTSVDNL